MHGWGGGGGTLDKWDSPFVNGHLDVLCMHK